MTLDSAGDINLDADDADIVLKDNGTEFGKLQNNSGALRIISSGDDVVVQCNTAGDMNIGVSGRTTACMGNYIVNGSCTAASYITSSDQSMKADVQDVASASAERLLGVRPVTYLIDGDTSGMRHAGVIAQEVETAVPECVRTMDNGTKGVEYQYLSMLLIKHVQDLTARIAALEAAASN